MTAKSVKPKTFEKAVARLEEIIEEMEAGDLPLETALKKFEEGIALSRFCAGKLDETERKITVLLKDGAGNCVEEPLDRSGG